MSANSKRTLFPSVCSPQSFGKDASGVVTHVRNCLMFNSKIKKSNTYHVQKSQSRSFFFTLSVKRSQSCSNKEAQQTDD